MFRRNADARPTHPQVIKTFGALGNFAVKVTPQTGGQPAGAGLELRGTILERNRERQTVGYNNKSHKKTQEKHFPLFAGLIQAAKDAGSKSGFGAMNLFAAHRTGEAAKVMGMGAGDSYPIRTVAMNRSDKQITEREKKIITRLAPPGGKEA
jgi:hypothetical protein